MRGQPKRQGSESLGQDLTTKRGRWESELAIPPSECSPTASGSALISGVHSAQISGGTFTVVGHDSSTTIHNYTYSYGSQTAPVDLLDILSSLSLPNFRDIQLDTLAKATEGTCIWFITGEMFLFWIKDGKILWGIGIPGAGKTVLASIVIRYLEGLEETSGGVVCVAYVYLRYSEPLTVRDVLELLVKQIVERHIDLVPIIEGLYAKHKREKTKPSQQELVDALAEFTRGGKCLFFVLDALDEMRVKDRPILVNLLASLEAKLFITSRPLEILQRRHPQAQVFNIAATMSDLDLYMKDFLRHSPEVVALLEGTDLEERIAQTIHRTSGGMFLHAQLQLEALHHCIGALDVEETLEGFPSDIGEIYMKTWERILSQGPKHSNLAKLVLLWITHANGEISIETLQRAVATSPETYTFEPKRMVPAALLLSVCCGLVLVDEKTKLVRLMRLYPVPHAIPAHVCIAHLINSGFQNYSWEIAPNDQSCDPGFRNDSLLAYAYESWAHHMRQCDHYRPVVSAAAELVLHCTKYPLENQSYTVNFGGPLHVAAFYGLADLIRPAARFSGRNALMLAVYDDHIECMELLAQAPGVDINAVDWEGRTALIHAVRWGRIEAMKQLLSLPGIDANAKDEDGWTALIHAVARGYTAIAQLLLKFPGIDINAVDQNGRTALILAVLTSRTEVVKLLLSTPGIDINVVCKSDKGTALSHASRRGDREIVNDLLAFRGQLYQHV
ncbi:hypothetical protein BKA70DRAFT_1403731 [Coprinopsis sp. MPI-PUGE-AT-0042]|nr:hypothetical protein BKA70DRAFT_1403731 [Coprinopsis sp. MPI-PUGE-AT-0042]